MRRLHFAPEYEDALTLGLKRTTFRLVRPTNPRVGDVVAVTCHGRLLGTATITAAELRAVKEDALATYAEAKEDGLASVAELRRRLVLRFPMATRFVRFTFAMDGPLATPTLDDEVRP